MRAVAGLVAAVAVLLAVSDAARSSRLVFPGRQGLIAFDRRTADGTDVAVVRPDRTGLRVLMANARDARWSPDGRYLAFERMTGAGDWSLCVANADGSDVRALADPGGNEIQPAWSSDGTQLVYVGYPHGRQYPAGDGELFIVNVDGSARRQLTHDPHEYYTSPSSPTWSPDGKWIAFIREGGVLSIVHPDGSGQRELPGDGTASSPSWSPDGTKIVYAAVGRGSKGGAWDDLYVVAVRGNAPARALTDTLAAESFPMWSPDGSAIVYTVFAVHDGLSTGHGDLYVIGADGSTPRPLVRGNASKWDADWQAVG